MSDINRRDHFRVEMTVPVRWKILNDNEIQILQNGMGNTLFKQSGIPNPIETFLEETPSGSKEEQLFLALQLLNNKMDYLIEQLLSRSTDKSCGHDDIMEISASGLKFCSNEEFNEGTLLKMELILPGIIQYSMELIAEILRVRKKTEKFINAARIVCIKEDSRDSIVKLIFQKQRIDIRKNKKQGEDKD